MQIVIQSTGDVIAVSEFYERHATVAFAQPLTDDVLAEFDARIHVPEPPPPAPVTIADVQGAVQARLDEWARERHYDGILSACSYASSTMPRFAAEAAAAVAARDATWSACYVLLAEIQAGARPMPAALTDVLAELPTLTWGDA